MAHELFHGCGLTGLLSDIGKVERDRFLYFTGGSLTSRVGLRWLWFLAFSLGALQALPDGLVLWPRLSQCEIGEETVWIRLEYDGDGSGRPTHKDITLTGMAAVHRRRAGELELPSMVGRQKDIVPSRWWWLLLRRLLKLRAGRNSEERHFCKDNALFGWSYS